MSLKLRRSAVIVCALLMSGCVLRLIDHLTGEDQASQIRKTGKAATARVLKIWDTGVSLNENPVVGFRLEVHVEGQEPFEAETRALIGRLDVPQIQPGTELPVKFDPADHSRVALDIYEQRQ